MNEFFTSCLCGLEILRISYDSEFKDIEISIFPFDSRKSLIQRFKYAWRILRTGEPFADQIILNKERWERLVRQISESIEDGKKENG